ncbi:MAG: hypothetical protein AAGU16_01745 [Desulfitobacterium hafniense]
MGLNFVIANLIKNLQQLCFRRGRNTPNGFFQLSKVFFDVLRFNTRRIYGKKRNVLLSSIAAVFGSSVQPWGDASGLHVALQFPGRKLEDTFMHECRNAGIRISPVMRYCSIKDSHTDKLLVGYGHLSHEQIQENVSVLHHFLAKTL